VADCGATTTVDAAIDADVEASADDAPPPALMPSASTPRCIGASFACATADDILNISASPTVSTDERGTATPPNVAQPVDVVDDRAAPRSAASRSRAISSLASWSVVA
jgi:hypothetical protein